MHYESITRNCRHRNCKGISVYVISLFQVYLSFKDFNVNFVYVLLFFKARNIVFELIVISQDYSLPLSKLFFLKGSLNLKERRGNFLVVF